MNLDFLAPLLYPAAIIAFFLSFSRPQLGIYYLVLVLPLQTMRYEIQSYPLGGSIIDIVLLGVLVGALLHRDEALFSELPVKWVLLVSFIYWYASLWHGSYSLSLPWPTSIDDVRFTYWKSYVEMGLLCFITFAVIKTEEQIRNVVLIMCASALVISVDFFQTVNGLDFSHFSPAIRYAGFIGYAGVNGLAAFDAILVLFLLGMLGSRVWQSWQRGLIVLAFLASMYALVFALSRGAYLAFAAGVLVMALLKKRVILVLALAGLIAGALMVPSAVSDRISGTYVESGDSEQGTLDNSSESRVLIWQDALEIFQMFPITGTGFQTYAFMHRTPGLSDTHNYYLKVLLEEGLLGFAIFLAVLAKMFAQGYRLFRSTDDDFLSSLGVAFVACITGAAVVNVFGDRWTYLQVDSYLWILLALVCRGRILARDGATEVAGEAAVPLGAVSLPVAN